MNALVQFYRGTHPDDQGRYLADILRQDDVWLERTHDYIQWVFPTRERSMFTPAAPITDGEVQQEFDQDAALREQLRVSFHRILAFYGLEYAESEIRKSGNWDICKHNWFRQETHNNLRITRILKCLTILGLGKEADDFYAALLKLRETERDCGVGGTAFRFWAEAVGVR